MSEHAEIMYEIRPSEEVYGRSLYGLRQLGRIAIEGRTGLIEEVYGDKRAWNDFFTATVENVTTDPEFGEYLVFDEVKEWNIVDGTVVSDDGTPMSDLIHKGWKSSKIAAENDSRMAIQALRDEGDVMVAKWVDRLLPGEMLAVVSMDPKRAIDSDSRFWEGTMAYRRGMAVIQTYYRANDTVITGTYAVKRSSTHAFALILHEHGVQINNNLDENLWTRYPIRKSTTHEQAMQFGAQLRQRHRALIGDTMPEYSVSEFITKQLEVVKQYFDTYMVPLAQALITGNNNDSLQQLAKEIVSTPTHFDQGLMRSLLRVANSRTFSEEDARNMEGMIRYALVEELRKKIPHYVQHTVRNAHSHDMSIYPQRFVDVASSYLSSAQHYVSRQSLHTQIAANIRSGSQAQRSYGGCAPGSILPVETNELSPFGLQNVFGSTETSLRSLTQEDEYGSLEFECTKGHKNRRPKGKLIPKCTTCKEDVLCG